MTDSIVSRNYSVAAVDRALYLMEIMGRLGPSPLATLAQAAGCTRPMAFRILRTLEQRGFSRQDGSRGLWWLGARSITIGRAATAQGVLAAEAQPILASLAKISGENTYLMMREGTMSRILAVHQADPGLWLHETVGQIRQLHAGPGRLLLAHAPAAIKKLALSERLARLTPHTKTDPARILADLSRIRARGYLLTVQEVHEASIDIAAPVWERRGDLLAVLFMTASTLRLAPVQAPSLVPTLLEHAARLSLTLGHPVVTSG